MPCYAPTRVLMDQHRELRWDQDYRSAGASDQVVNINCRSCIGCRQAAARDWSVRCFHEAQLHSRNWTSSEEDGQITTKIPNNSVITLTYRDEHLPLDRALRHDDFMRFMKRLRKARNGQIIRFMMAGEYGHPKNGARPHFHAVLFGVDFDDLYETIDRSGKIQKHSHELDSLWTQKPSGSPIKTNIGRATVDTVSFAGVAYVAGYVAKKTAVQGHQGPLRESVNLKTGEITIRPIKAEYRVTSTRGAKDAPIRGGLGYSWISKMPNLLSVYAEDQIQISVYRFHPPKYYDSILKRYRPDLLSSLRASRLEAWSEHSKQWDEKRCSAAEQIALDDLQSRRDSL